MSDIATLGIRVDASEAEVAKRQLADLAAQGGQTEGAIDRLGQTSRETSASLSGAAQAAQGAAAASDGAARAAGVHGAALRGEAAAAEGASSSLREMAAAIQAQEAAYRAAGQGVQAAGAQAKGAAAGFGEFYDAAQRDFATQYVQQVDAVNRAHNRGAAGARLNAHELANLGRQFADVGVSAAMGMNPLMILVQQGPQIADVFATGAARGVTFKAALGGIGEMMGGVGLAGGALIAILTAIVAVVGLVTAGFLAGQAEAAKVANALKITGDAAGYTAEQFENMAERVGDAANTTTGAARDVGLIFVESGRVSGRALELMTENVLTLAKYTGKSREEIARNFAGMGDDVAGFAAKFNDQYHMLSLAQYEHIALLQEQGNTTQAQLSLAIAMHEELREKGEADLGLLEQAWRGVAGAIADAWEALKNFGKESGVEEQIANLNSRISTGQTRNRANGVEDRYTEVSALIAQRDALLKVKAAEDARRAAEGQSQRDNEAAIKATREHASAYASMGDNLSLVAREQKKYLDGQAAIRKVNPNSPALDNPQRQREVLAEIERKYTPLATAAAKAADRAADAAQRRAEKLAREAEAQEATIAGNLALADAYLISADAARVQEATTKATAEAIKDQGAIAEYVDRQTRLAASKVVVDAAKRARALIDEAEARRVVNDQVAEGLLTVAEGNRWLADEAERRELITLIAKAEGDERERLTRILNGLTEAQAKNRAETARTDAQASTEDSRRRIADLRQEFEWRTLSNAELAKRIAMREEEQRITARFGAAYAQSPEGQEAIKTKGLEAEAIVDSSQALAAFNDLAGLTVDRMSSIGAMADANAGALAAMFDDGTDGAARFITAIGRASNVYASFGARQKALIKERADAEKRYEVSANATAEQRAASEAALAEVYKRTSREISDAQIGAYADMAAAAKGYFEEGSTGYKALEIAETAFRAIQLAGSIASMFQDATETASAVANSGARAAASTTAGAAKSFEQMGVYGFIGAAAIIAFMAAMGVSVGGGGAGGSYDLEEVQNSQGTGTVLGDSKAKSDSIRRSLEIVAANSVENLEYSNAMLKSLRSIDDGIADLTAAIARSLGVGGFLTGEGIDKTVNQNNGFWKQGANTNPWVALGVGGGPDPLGLFNTTTAKKLVDAGINFATQTLGDALTKGLDAETFQTVQTTTTQKILGIFSTSKSKTKTTTAELDPEITRQFGLIIQGLRDGVLEAAAVLGVEGAGAVLDSFQLNLGKISFKDMTSAEISETLQAVFSAAGDDMAKAVLPGLTELQKAGEGLFETLMRVARQYQVIDLTLASIGMTFATVGVESLAARERLVELFGGLDEFQSAVGFYADNFLTEAERLAPVQSAVTAELARLGLTGIKTRDQFKAVVQGLDVSTAAGAELFAALMNLAPAFAAVTEETQAIADARDALSEAYSRESSALADTKQRFEQLASSLGDYRASLYSGPAAALGPEAAYFAAQAEFNRVNALAQAGNADALGDLQGVSEAYLEASKNYYASTAGYFADLAAVREAVTAAEGIANTQVDVAQASLDALEDSVAGLGIIDETIQKSTAELIAELRALLGTAPTVTVTPSAAAQEQTAAQVQAANDNSAAMMSEIQKLREEIRAGNDQRGAVAVQTLARLDALEAQMAGVRVAME